jgi:hypothetical protein
MAIPRLRDGTPAEVLLWLIKLPDQTRLETNHGPRNEHLSRYPHHGGYAPIAHPLRAAIQPWQFHADAYGCEDRCQ